MAVLIKFLSTIIMGTPGTTTQAKLNEIKRISNFYFNAYNTSTDLIINSVQMGYKIYIGSKGS